MDTFFNKLKELDKLKKNKTNIIPKNLIDNYKDIIKHRLKNNFSYDHFLSIKEMENDMKRLKLDDLVKKRKELEDSRKSIDIKKDKISYDDFCYCIEYNKELDTLFEYNDCEGSGWDCEKCSRKKVTVKQCEVCLSNQCKKCINVEERYCYFCKKYIRIVGCDSCITNYKYFFKLECCGAQFCANHWNDVEICICGKNVKTTIRKQLSKIFTNKIRNILSCS